MSIENPYPEDVFPGYDAEDMRRIDAILSASGYSFTRLNGSWGRHVWDYATRDARHELARELLEKSADSIYESDATRFQDLRDWLREIAGEE